MTSVARQLRHFFFRLNRFALVGAVAAVVGIEIAAYFKLV
jgi:hypothetical protein